MPKFVVKTTFWDTYMRQQSTFVYYLRRLEASKCHTVRIEAILIVQFYDSIVQFCEGFRFTPMTIHNTR